MLDLIQYIFKFDVTIYVGYIWTRFELFVFFVFLVVRIFRTKTNTNWNITPIRPNFNPRTPIWCQLFGYFSKQKQTPIETLCLHVQFSTREFRSEAISWKQICTFGTLFFFALCARPVLGSLVAFYTILYAIIACYRIL